MSVKKIAGTILLAAVVFAVRTALRLEQGSYAQETDQTQSETSFSLPSLNFLSKNRAVKSMKLTSFDKLIYQGCLTDHEIQQAGDYPNVSAQDLCACSAKHATAKIPSEHLSEYMRIHAVSLNDSIMSARAETKHQQDEVEKSWVIVRDNMIKNSDLSKQDFMKTLAMAADINTICRSPELYRAKSLAKIAQLQPLHMQSQDVTLKLRPAINEQLALK